MGYRLEGPAITHLHGHNIVSDGTVNGSIQIPGNGQPIVLMPDRGTTGGYPKIATVITADLGRLAQTHAGPAFRFKAVEHRRGPGGIPGDDAAVARPARPVKDAQHDASTSTRCTTPMSPAPRSTRSTPEPAEHRTLR